MAAIPSLEAEDAKRPSRERENLVGERTRIGNRIKSTLARFGIRGFKPILRTAVQRLERLRTRRENRYRPTHWPSCGARWHGCACSLSRSGRSKRRGWSGWNGNPTMVPIR